MVNSYSTLHLKYCNFSGPYILVTHILTHTHTLIRTPLYECISTHNVFVSWTQIYPTPPSSAVRVQFWWWCHGIVEDINSRVILQPTCPPQLQVSFVSGFQNYLRNCLEVDTHCATIFVKIILLEQISGLLIFQEKNLDFSTNFLFLGLGATI